MTKTIALEPWEVGKTFSHALLSQNWQTFFLGSSLNADVCKKPAAAALCSQLVIAWDRVSASRDQLAPSLWFHGEQTCWDPGCSDSWCGPSFFLDLCLCLSFLHCLATQVRIPHGSRQGLITFCFSSSRGSFASSNLPVHILMYIHKVFFRKSLSKVFPFFSVV